MGIKFSADDWARTKENYTKWWNKELDRPLVPIVLEGRDPGRPQPAVPILTQATCTDLSIPAETLIDRLDYELSRYEYLGDSFPYINMDVFGPGVMNAFLGAELRNETGYVWFYPQKVRPIEELHFEYDGGNIWLNRVKDVCHAAMKRWKGQVLVGMPDLGSAMDVLSAFRPGNELLFDLYDSPEEVKRLVGEVIELWMQFYREINEVLQPVNPGYCDWSKIYSDKPSYVIQSDFSYMIGPEMFEEFVLPEIRQMCKDLDRTMYHLDGVGQLNHLDMLLGIKELDAVQWVPGSNAAPHNQWPEVWRKIQAAGKNMQINVPFLNYLDDVIDQIGTGKGIHLEPVVKNIAEKESVLDILKGYGITS